jgi:hypothetical protein
MVYKKCILFNYIYNLLGKAYSGDHIPKNIIVDTKNSNKNKSLKKINKMEKYKHIIH